MNKATPVQMRQALIVVEALKQAGMRFVPMPVLDDEDHDRLAEQALLRMTKIEHDQEG